MLLHLGPNVITIRTLLHLEQLLHLGLQHSCLHWIVLNHYKISDGLIFLSRHSLRNPNLSRQRSSSSRQCYVTSVV